jgi:hypothetical protein
MLYFEQPVLGVPSASYRFRLFRAARLEKELIVAAEPTTLAKAAASGAAIVDYLRAAVSFTRFTQDCRVQGCGTGPNCNDRSAVGYRAQAVKLFFLVKASILYEMFATATAQIAIHVICSLSPALIALHGEEGEKRLSIASIRGR